MNDELIKRIGDNYLPANHKDGDTFLHTDYNEFLSIFKTAINENYFDIQKIINGSIKVSDSSKLDGASLSQSVNGILSSDDNTVPSSKQVKEYIDDQYEDLQSKNDVLSGTVSNNTESIKVFNDSVTELKDSKANVSETGSSIEILLNNENYIITVRLLDKTGKELSTSNIDLPLESVVVGAEYIDGTKTIRLSLKNGEYIDVPVSSLVSGLVSDETFNRKVEELQNQIDNKISNIPLATENIIGGVKPVAKTEDMTTPVGIDEYGKLYTSDMGDISPGGSGATFTPSVSVDGIISWTNDKGLENPESVNIKGPQGPQGVPGENGTSNYNELNNMPIINLVGTQDNPIKIDWFTQKGIYRIKGYSKLPFMIISSPNIVTELEETDEDTIIVISEIKEDSDSSKSVGGIYLSGMDYIGDYGDKAYNFGTLMKMFNINFSKTETNISYNYEKSYIVHFDPLINIKNNGIITTENFNEYFNTFSNCFVWKGETNDTGLDIFTRFMNAVMEMSYDTKFTLYYFDDTIGIVTPMSMILDTNNSTEDTYIFSAQSAYINDENKLVKVSSSITYTMIGHTLECTNISEMQTTTFDLTTGIATGGKTNQVLAKSSNADYDTKWIQIPNQVLDSLNGNSTTEAPSQRAVNEAIRNLVFPIGSIIYNASEAFDPNVSYGGTWEKIKGKMIIGYDDTDDDFNTLGKAGGSKTHTQTINEMPSHLHTYHRTGSTTSAGYNSIFGSSAQTGSDTISSSKTGGGKAMNIMNPYYVANIWLRTA